MFVIKKLPIHLLFLSFVNIRKAMIQSFAKSNSAIIQAKLWGVSLNIITIDGLTLECLQSHWLSWNFWKKSPGRIRPILSTLTLCIALLVSVGLEHFALWIPASRSWIKGIFYRWLFSKLMLSTNWWLQSKPFIYRKTILTQEEVMDILLKMRSCRQGLVQTPEQLKFSFQAIGEAISTMDLTLDNSFIDNLTNSEKDSHSVINGNKAKHTRKRSTTEDGNDNPSSECAEETCVVTDEDVTKINGESQAKRPKGNKDWWPWPNFPPSSCRILWFYKLIFPRLAATNLNYIPVSHTAWPKVSVSFHILLINIYKAL